MCGLSPLLQKLSSCLFVSSPRDLSPCSHQHLMLFSYWEPQWLKTKWLQLHPASSKIYQWGGTMASLVGRSMPCLSTPFLFCCTQMQKALRVSQEIYAGVCGSRTDEWEEHSLFVHRYNIHPTTTPSLPLCVCEREGGGRENSNIILNFLRKLSHPTPICLKQGT